MERLTGAPTGFWIEALSKPGEKFESADERMVRLRKWFTLKGDGTAGEPDVQPELDRFGHKNPKLPFRSKRLWAVGMPNNAMCNIMTWTMLEISTARYNKYKTLVAEAQEKLEKDSKSFGIALDAQPGPGDEQNPVKQGFFSLKRRRKRLKTLERESMRQAVGVMRGVILDPMMLAMDEYDRTLIVSVIEIADANLPDAAPTNATLTAPISGLFDGQPDADPFGNPRQPRRARRPPKAGGLFGADICVDDVDDPPESPTGRKPAFVPGLFVGQQPTQPQPPSQGGGLFGNMQQTPIPADPRGLFGAPTAPPPPPPGGDDLSQAPAWMFGGPEGYPKRDLFPQEIALLKKVYERWTLDRSMQDARTENSNTAGRERQAEAALREEALRNEDLERRERGAGARARDEALNSKLIDERERDYERRERDRPYNEELIAFQKLDLAQRQRDYAEKERDRPFQDEIKEFQKLQLVQQKRDYEEREANMEWEQREKELKRDAIVQGEKVKRERERQQELEKELTFDEGPIPIWNPAKAAAQVVAVLTDIEKKYTGNDKLKDYIYQDVVSFLGDAKGAMDVYRNYVFMGPSGVGKTTWARAMGKIYKAVGMYLYGIVAETAASDYVAGYIGQTAPFTEATLNSNLENIIIIDEAYAITESASSTGGGNVGKEAITALVNWMDKNIGCYMIIIAGYEDKMMNSFLPNNEGLDRRFPKKFVFPEYTGKQMSRILVSMLKPSGNDQLWADYTWDYMADLIQTSKESYEYFTEYAAERQAALEKGAAMGLNQMYMQQNGLLPKYDEVRGRYAIFYNMLFSKQGGSIQNVAAMVQSYMRIPDKLPARGQKLKYDNDMMTILLLLLPGKYQEEIKEDGSLVRQFLEIPLGPSVTGKQMRKVTPKALTYNEASLEFERATEAAGAATPDDDEDL